MNFSKASFSPLKSFILLAFSLVLFACGNSSLGKEGSTPPSHELWNQLLEKHVKSNGMVDYKGFVKDKSQLETYLDLLSTHAPDRKTWSKEKQLAYWINAYNAFTVKLIVDHYPVESIRDLGPKLKIPLVNDVWHYKFFQIGGVETSLDEIEHGILRKEFNEPRIHFAINCASISCPPLQPFAFTSDQLESQLESVSVKFINDTLRNKIQKDKVEISSIFSWFSGDFTKDGSIIDFLNRYSKIQISKNAKVSYLDYNWSLNE